MLKKFLILLLIGVGALIAVLLVNTLTFKSKQVYEEVKPAPRATDSSILHFQRAVAFKTISYENHLVFDSVEFIAFHEYLRNTYPLTHEKLQLKTIAGASLLYMWEGDDPQLNPFVLMAHQDVVPIEEASRHLWTVDPFACVVRDGWIWGRGTADDKINLIGILEAVEKLLAEGFSPRRTIYLAFGHDEEVGGKGAKAMAAYLKSQNVRADLVLDEGGIITRSMVPGMTQPVALLGTAEKGYLSLELSIEQPGGHSSMPAHETAMGILSKALVAIHDNPFPAGFSRPTEGFADHVGPEMPLFEKMVFANRWMFERVVVNIYEQTPAGNALVRTTSAPTIFQSGFKDNIIPTEAAATVNFRLLPGDTTQKVIAYVNRIISDERVKVTPHTSFIAEPSAVTPDDGPAFKRVSRIVHEVWPKTIVTPFLMIGGTDSRHMELISDQIVKFSPMTDPIGFHGIDERVSIESFEEAIWFFENLIRSSDAN